MVSQSTTGRLFIRVRAALLTGGGLFVRAPGQSSEQEVIKQPLSRCDDPFCGNGTSPRPRGIQSGRERGKGGGAPRGDKRRLARRKSLMDATAGDLFKHKHTSAARRGARRSNTCTRLYGALKMGAINPPQRSNWLLMERGRPSLGRVEGARRSTCWPLPPDWLRGLSLGRGKRSARRRSRSCACVIEMFLYVLFFFSHTYTHTRARVPLGWRS